jgi:predicted XRE-type DNA-binding protein
MNNPTPPKNAQPNIFEELGFSPQEAENLKIRSELMLNLHKLIQIKQWSSSQAATHLGESTATIESLLQGEIEKFTIAQLIAMLTHAGIKVRLELLPNVA